MLIAVVKIDTKFYVKRAKVDLHEVNYNCYAKHLFRDDKIIIDWLILN